MFFLKSSDFLESLQHGVNDVWNENGQFPLHGEYRGYFVTYF